jgi:hypothetical protein
MTLSSEKARVASAINVGTTDRPAANPSSIGTGVVSSSVPTTGPKLQDHACEPCANRGSAHVWLGGVQRATNCHSSLAGSRPA